MKVVFFRPTKWQVAVVNLGLFLGAQFNALIHSGLVRKEASPRAGRVVLITEDGHEEGINALHLTKSSSTSSNWWAFLFLWGSLCWMALFSSVMLTILVEWRENDADFNMSFVSKFRMQSYRAHSSPFKAQSLSSSGFCFLFSMLTCAWPEHLCYESRCSSLCVTSCFLPAHNCTESSTTYFACVAHLMHGLTVSEGYISDYIIKRKHLG